MGEFRVSGFFVAAKMTHLSDDETVAKMGPDCGGAIDVSHLSGDCTPGPRVSVAMSDIRHRDVLP